MSILQRVHIDDPDRANTGIVDRAISSTLVKDMIMAYKFHTGMPWWIFAVAGIGALAITLLTVSYQAAKAGLTNPAKSLRSE